MACLWPTEVDRPSAVILRGPMRASGTILLSEKNQALVRL